MTPISRSVLGLAAAACAIAFTSAPAIAAPAQAGTAATPAAPNACELAVEIDPELEMPDIDDAEDATPEGAWFRSYGAPEGHLCIAAEDGSVRAVPFGTDGFTEPVYFTWGPHLVWQATGGTRSHDVVLNLDCWDLACLP